MPVTAAAGRTRCSSDRNDSRLPIPLWDSATETLTPASFRFTVITLARTPARRTWRKVTPEGWALAGAAQKITRAISPAARQIRESRGMVIFRGDRQRCPSKRAGNLH